MTVIATWFEKNYIWTIADTRISKTGNNGIIKMTDCASKLYSIPVICNDAYNSLTASPKAKLSTSIGFGFAGDIMPATMTLSTATTLMQQLVCIGDYIPPQLSQIVDAITKIAERLSKDALSSTNGSYGKFEAVISGICPNSSQPEIYHIFPIETENTFKMKFEKVALEDVLIIGSGKNRLRKKIKFLNNKNNINRIKTNIPRQAIEALILEDEGDVGGSLSLGFISPFGFTSCWIPTKNDKNSSEARIYNGIDLDEEIGQIGPCIIGGVGMA